MKRMGLTAIETIYNGYRFRSRTEARWAVFFDAAGIKYEYEKEGFDIDGRPYLPDFWLPELDAWFEVKGSQPTEEEIWLCERLHEKSGKRVFLAYGEPYSDGFAVDDMIKNTSYRMLYWPYPPPPEDCYPDEEAWEPYSIPEVVFIQARRCENLACQSLDEDFDFLQDVLQPCRNKECRGCEKTHYLSERLIEAFKKARRARFEHKQKSNEL